MSVTRCHGMLWPKNRLADTLVIVHIHSCQWSSSGFHTSLKPRLKFYSTVFLFCISDKDYQSIVRGAILQHWGIRKSASQTLRRDGFLIPTKTISSLHLSQKLFEQNFAIFEVFLASTEFWKTKHENITLIIFIFLKRSFWRFV